MEKKFIKAALTVLILSGCATPAEVYDFDKSDILSTDFNQTWENIIEYFAENNIAIQTLEKDSGIIVAETERLTTEEIKLIASCPTIGFAQPTGNIARYNIFAKSIEAGTRVQVNIDYSTIMPTGSIGGAAYERTPCNSNGKVEAAVLEKIRG